MSKKIDISKIKFNTKYLKEFKKMGIDVVYLFGSQVEGFAHAMSDLDIGIVFANPSSYENNTLKVYSKLYDIFYEVFPKYKTDIVFLQFTPFDLQLDVVKNGVVIYQKDKVQFYDYREYVIKRFADLKYFYDLHQKAILARL